LSKLQVHSVAANGIFPPRMSRSLYRTHEGDVCILVRLVISKSYMNFPFCSQLQPKVGDT
jgi:hypothetical protein